MGQFPKLTHYLTFYTGDRFPAWKGNVFVGGMRRGRGYKNLRYLLLKAQHMAATRTEFIVFRKAA